MNKIIKNALILAAITLIAGLLLGAAHQVTLEPIQKQQEKEKQSAALIIEIDGKQRNINDTRQQVLPERHINNQETDKKEEKQSAAEKYRSIVMVGHYIAKFVE